MALRPGELIELATFFDSEAYKQQVDSSQAKGSGSKDMTIKRLDYISRSYSYIGWNEATPYFNSKKVRQAMTMAIDRKGFIKQYLNGLG